MPYSKDEEAELAFQVLADAKDFLERENTMLRSELQALNKRWHDERSAHLHYEEIAKSYSEQRDNLVTELQAAQRRIHDQNMEIMRLDDGEELQALKQQLQAAQAEVVTKVQQQAAYDLERIAEVDREKFALQDQLAASQREVERLKEEKDTLHDQRCEESRENDQLCADKAALQAALDVAVSLLEQGHYTQDAAAFLSSLKDDRKGE